MKTIKGPAIFLAQFAGDAPPFNSLPAIADWAAGLGFKGLQIPSWDRRLFDLEKAAESQTYCDEVKGTLAQRGLQVTELSTHLQGQLVAVHPAYDTAFDGFAAAAGARQAGGAHLLGDRAVQAGGQGLAPARRHRARDLLRRARLALSLSLAAAAGRTGRDRVRRAGQALAPDPRRLRRRGRQCLLRDPPRRRPA